MKLRVTRNLLAALATSAMVLAACGDGDAPTEPPASSAGSESQAGGDGSEPSTAAGEPIKLGAVIMLSGPSGIYGEVVTNGFKFGVQEINASGGVDGRPLELVVEDNASDDAQTVALIRKLADDDSIVGLLGPQFTANYLAGQPVANEREIVWFAASSGIVVDADGKTSPFGGLENAAPYSFQNMLPYGVMVEQQLSAVLDATDPASAAIIFQGDNPAMAFTNDLTRPVLEDSGVELVDEVEVETDTNDYGPQISALVRAQPDVVLINMVTEGAAQFMRQARERGLESQWVAPSNALLNDRLYELSGGAAAGLLVPSHLDPDDPDVQAFTEAFEKDHGSLDDLSATFGYDAVGIIAEALTSVVDGGEEIARGSLKASLDGLDEYCGISGCYEYDGSGNFLIKDVLVMELGPEGYAQWDN